MKIKILTAFLCAALVLPCLTGCFGRTEYYTDSFFAMDTIIELKIIRTASDTFDANKIFDECEKKIKIIENTISKTVEQSDVFILNSDINVMIDIDGVFRELLTRSIDISDATGGAFDITVGSLVALWNKCGEENRYPSEDEVKGILKYVGMDKIELDGDTVNKSFKETKIDLGAIGKGYAAGKIIAYLKTTDATGGILSFGGNVAVFGKKQSGKPFKVGIRDPFDESSVVGYTYIDSGYVSVSGDSERFIEISGEKYNHIIDPASGYPVSNGLHSVAVICDDGTLADALSTALFVMGKDKAIEFYKSGAYDFDAVFVSVDGVFVTRGLDGVFEAAGHTGDFEYCG